MMFALSGSIYIICIIFILYVYLCYMYYPLKLSVGRASKYILNIPYIKIYYILKSVYKYTSSILLVSWLEVIGIWGEKINQ